VRLKPLSHLSDGEATVKVNHQPPRRNGFFTAAAPLADRFWCSQIGLLRRQFNRSTEKPVFVLDGSPGSVCIVQSMNLKILPIFALSALAVLGSGCVGTIDGGTKAGVPFVKDTLESKYERPVAQIISAAKVVLDRNGKLTGDNTVNNTLVGRVDTRTVWIRVTELDNQVSQVITQVRTRGGRSDIDLASEIDKQIALQLAVAR
jgi:hypothetical protein